jgi:hypothetical protein
MSAKLVEYLHLKNKVFQNHPNFFVGQNILEKKSNGFCYSFLNRSDIVVLLYNLYGSQIEIIKRKTQFVGL